MEIQSLGNTGFDTIYEGFSQAFANYELQLGKTQLRAMFTRRGFNAGLSFAAFEANRIVAFTCNGTGSFEGQPTAYDTGTGTLKDYRSKGLATQIFEYSIPRLREAGIRQYLLEVLQHNDKAVSVYRNLGFEVTREFHYFNQNNAAIRNEAKTPAVPVEVRTINIEDYSEIPGFRDFHPSWQNSFESIRRSPEGFLSLGAFADEKLAGYCVFEPASGDVTQIAVGRPHRRQGIGSLLLAGMINANLCDSVKILNTDVTCGSITGFLKAKNIEPKGKQFEMVKKI